MARRRKRSKSWISWLIILILLIAACVMVYLVWDSYFNDDKEKPQVDETEKVEEKTEPVEGEFEPEAEKVEQKEEIIQYDGENPNQGSDITGVVTYAGVSGGKLMIRVNINQYLSGGSCALRLLFENDVVMYSDTASVVDSASTSTCEGFDVPTAGLSSGNYKIIINVDSGAKTGVINGEVNL